MQGSPRGALSGGRATDYDLYGEIIAQLAGGFYLRKGNVLPTSVSFFSSNVLVSYFSSSINSVFLLMLTISY